MKFFFKKSPAAQKAAKIRREQFQQTQLVARMMLHEGAGLFFQSGDTNPQKAEENLNHFIEAVGKVEVNDSGKMVLAKDFFAPVDLKVIALLAIKDVLKNGGYEV